jgi:hypothetical protein
LTDVRLGFPVLSCQEKGNRRPDSLEREEEGVTVATAVNAPAWVEVVTKGTGRRAGK